MPEITDKLEKEATEWIELVTGESFDGSKTFQENLKDGTLLCKAFNYCFTDLKVKYTHSAMPFKQMENIATFLAALAKLPNFRSFDLFSTVDLYEGKNMAQVTRCILACKRFAEKEATAAAGMINGLKTLNINPSAETESKQQAEPEVQEEPSLTESTTTEDSTQAEPEQQQLSPINETEFHDIISSPTEIVLVESPNLADDEADDLVIVEKEVEEFETFTQENPGTFEIQVSN